MARKHFYNSHSVFFIFSAMHISFSHQCTGLGVCLKQLRFQFSLFHQGTFQFIPWTAVSWQNLTTLRTLDYHIPMSSEIDNSMLESLENTY